MRGGNPVLKYEFNVIELDDKPCLLLQDRDINYVIEDYEFIEENITDNSRWSIHYNMISKAPDGKFYSVDLSRGATEEQYEAPFEYDSDEIKCSEVYKTQKLVDVWEEV